MKPPDLSAVEEAGVHAWKGAVEPLKAAAAQANVTFAVADLGKARDKGTLIGELDRALKLPDHFGQNWDALADVLEDRDWVGKKGRAIVLAHADGFRKSHPADWATLEEILAEAAEFWKERHIPFWVFLA